MLSADRFGMDDSALAAKENIKQSLEQLASLVEDEEKDDSDSFPEQSRAIVSNVKEQLALMLNGRETSKSDTLTLDSVSNRDLSTQGKSKLAGSKPSNFAKDESQGRSKQTREPQNLTPKVNDESKVINSAHPTPFAVWSSAYEKKQAPPSPIRRLKQVQSENVANRLYDSCREKHVSSLHKATRSMAKDMCELSFTPEINNTSRKIARMIPPLHERLDFVLKARADRIERRRLKLEERDMAEVTRVPKTNTGKTTWIPRVRKNYTNSSNALAEGMLAEEAELTFSPRINEWSRRLCERARSNPYDEDGNETSVPAWNHGRRFRVTGTCEDAGHHEETFHPVINHRSRFAVKAGHSELEVSAFDRLYEMAMQREAMLGRRKPNTSAGDKASKKPGRAQTSEKDRNERRPSEECSRESTSVNVVAYGEECDAVLRIVRSAASARDGELWTDN